MTDDAGDDATRDPLDPFGDAPDVPSRDGRSNDDRSESSSGRVDGDERAAPLDDLASSVRERRDRPDGVDAELFEERDVAEIDADVVWERLEDEEPDLEADSSEPTVRVVEKADYCEGCPHFTSPPDVRCTHEGTEILELVDVDHFRVANCPVVRKDERLEEL